MKYKCADCGAVYDKKIEYCECGNNIFEEIDTSSSKPEKSAYASPSNFMNGEIVSWCFFIFCLILSLVILCIPYTKPLHPNINRSEVETKSIPDIEKIWKNPQIIQPKEIETTPAPIVIKKIIRRIEEPAVSHPVTKNVSQNISKPQTSPPVNDKPIASPKIKETSPEVKSTAPTTPAANPTDPVLIRYKNILREVLLSKLAVGSIPGEGTCIIEFSIDSTGKLVNRKFVQYANNKPMNDAIYYMLMSVPKFQQPPAAYNGEPIKLKFYIHNGEYEISFL